MSQISYTQKSKLFWVSLLLLVELNIWDTIHSYREIRVENSRVIYNLISKTDSWRACILSKASKVTYIKSVLLSLPTFIFPRSLCD